MAKALKVLLYIYGILLIVLGLGLIFLPDQMAAMWGASGISDFTRFTGGTLGAIYLAAGIWVVVAARDPLGNLSWVKFVIAKGSLTIVFGVYAIIMGYIALNASLPMLIADVVLIALILVCYPWRRARSTG